MFDGKCEVFRDFKNFPSARHYFFENSANYFLKVANYFLKIANF